MDKKVLGVITARGGSKSIPGKNIKLFLGKPLIVYTIEAAKESGAFDRIILSTDDDEIAKVGRQYGVDVPFKRPKELAQDTTPHLPVMQHVVQWLKDNENYYPDYVMILQPTSPLRKAIHIKEAIEVIKKYQSDSVVSISPVPSHFNPHWQFVLTENSKLRIFTGEPFREIIRRRQELIPTYTKNGAIYLFKTDILFREHPSFYGEDVRGYAMEEEYSINIDTLDDWGIAEALFKKDN